MNTLNWRIGLVGYGEVGRILAEDLRVRGMQVSVRLAQSPAELASDADLIVSLTASQEHEI